MQIKLTLTEQEAEALAGLMDAGVRAQGLAAAGTAAHLAGKLQEAAKAAKDEADKAGEEVDG